MAKSTLKLVSPATVNRTVTPLRRPNAELRPREHLTERATEGVVAAAEVVVEEAWAHRRLFRKSVSAWPDPHGSTLVSILA
jgi:type 1 fimbriae regulatory protein FimB/type 1 fimbriae regulatory protein FimE